MLAFTLGKGEVTSSILVTGFKIKSLLHKSFTDFAVGFLL
jgi:hypothetical protein